MARFGIPRNLERATEGNRKLTLAAWTTGSDYGCGWEFWKQATSYCDFATL